MPITCPYSKAPCFAIECCGQGKCFQDQLEDEVKLSRRCEDLGIYCYQPECLEKDECKQLASVTRSNYAARPSWTCPHDNKPCDMVTCKNGTDCYAKTSPIVHGTTYSAPTCHEGMHMIGEVGKAKIYLGREAAAKNWNPKIHGKVALIVGLLGDPYPQGNPIGMNEQAKTLALDNLNVIMPIIPNIWIKWPDFGVVPMGRDWWQFFVDKIAQLDGAVLIYCFGGHGRTGTAGVIIACLAGLVPEGDDPVLWLRQKYCSKIVESDAQLDYIEEITGRKTQAQAAKEVYTTYGASHTYVKKKTSGGAKKSKKPARPASEAELSKRQWKRWWRKNARADHPCYLVSRPNDLPDGAEFEVKGKRWQWSAADKSFCIVEPKP